MKKLTSLAPIAAALVVVCLSARPASASNIVVNGGFETGDFTGWVIGGNTGFTSVDGSVVHSGAFSADLGPVGSDGTMTQNLATSAGASYDLTFWLWSDGGQTNDFSVFWNGAATSVNMVNMGAFPFTEFTVSGLIATGSSTSLSFHYRDDPGFVHLDDIEVNAAVPEPTSLLLLGSGLAAAFLRVRRNARRS